MDWQVKTCFTQTLNRGTVYEPPSKTRKGHWWVGVISLNARVREMGRRLEAGPILGDAKSTEISVHTGHSSVAPKDLSSTNITTSHQTLGKDTFFFPPILSSIILRFPFERSQILSWSGSVSCTPKGRSKEDNYEKKNIGGDLENHRKPKGGTRWQRCSSLEPSIFPGWGAKVRWEILVIEKCRSHPGMLLGQGLRWRRPGIGPSHKSMHAKVRPGPGKHFEIMEEGSSGNGWLILWWDHDLFEEDRKSLDFPLTSGRDSTRPAPITPCLLIWGSVPKRMHPLI